MIITYLDTICCQEKDALEVLELTEEYANERVPVNVVHVPLFKENIGLVQEKDGAPGVTDVEDLLQLTLKEARVGTKLASRGHVKRAFEELADALGR